MQLPLYELKSDWRPPSLDSLPSWSSAKRIAIDCETCDPQLRDLGPGCRRGGYTTGWAVALEDGPSFYLPIRHAGGDNLPAENVLAYMRDNAKHFDGEIVGANLSYDLDYAANDEIKFHPGVKFRDIQVADPLIYELHQYYSLKAIGERWDVHGKEEDLLLKAAQHYGVDPKGDMWKLPARYVGEYAANDTAAPLEIYAKQWEEIQKKKLERVFDLESRVLPVLVRMRRRGVRIDQNRLQVIEDMAEVEEQEHLDEIHRLTGIKIGLGEVWKVKLVAPALEAIGIKLQKTPTGAPKVDAATLERLDHPVGMHIRQARQTNKLRTTFCKTIKNHMINGRIHATMNQIARENEAGDQKGVRYGRLSSDSPNLQQMPSPDRANTKLAKAFREIFLPEEDSLWGCNDYCFSDDTEVLTEERGFVLFKDLVETDLVAQMNPKTREITFAQPIEYQKKWYDDKLIRIYASRTTDLFVTPNHKCLLYQLNGNSLFKLASDYPSNHQGSKYRQVNNGILKEGTWSPSDDEIVTSVAIQADGTYRDRENKYLVNISKSRKIQRFLEYGKLIKDFRKTLKDPKNNTHSFLIEDYHALLLLSDKKKEKIFDREALLCMTLERKLFFLKELMYWDGTKDGFSEYGRYKTTEKTNAEIVQIIAILSGLSAKIDKQNPSGKKSIWRVSIKNTDNSTTSNMVILEIPYKGFVYCVTMPQSTVIVRRNGRVSITGQSQQEPRWVTHYSNLMGFPRASEMVEKYQNDPSLDNHAMMTELIHGQELINTWAPSLYKQNRAYAKDIFLGICYGEGGAKMCKNLGLPTRFALIERWRGQRVVTYYPTRHRAMIAKQERGSPGTIREVAGEEGQQILDLFNERVPYVKKVQQAATNRAKSIGFVRTHYGRRLHFQRKEDGQIDWGHKALNRIIQGSSADQAKQAIINMDEAGYFIQLPVHDEVDGSYESPEQAKEAGLVMKEAVLIEIPFKVDTEVGKNWGNLKSV